MDEGLPVVSIYIAFYGEVFDPYEVTRYVGIEPTRQIKRGDPMPPGTGKRQRNGWMIQVGPAQTFRIDGMLAELKSAVSSSPELIKEVCSRLELGAVRTCVAEAA